MEETYLIRPTAHFYKDQTRVGLDSKVFVRWIFSFRHFPVTDCDRHSSTTPDKSQLLFYKPSIVNNQGRHYFSSEKG